MSAPQIFAANIDIDVAFDLRRHVHGREGGVPAGVGVERADAHQPMHAGLALEVAVGELPLDLESGAANPGLVIAQLIDQLDLTAMPLGPARVHAHEHLGPVARFGAALPRLDANEGVAAVLRSAQHGPQFEVAELLFELGQFLGQLVIDAGVLFAELNQSLEILGRRFESGKGIEQAVEGLELAG